MSEIFKWFNQVRSYELDRQNIVNHATIISYFEEARAEFAHSIGIDFNECVKAGFDFVLAGLEVQYRKPLFIQNKFYVTVKLDSFDDKRMHYSQEIYKEGSNKPASKAVIHLACVDVNTGRACMPDMLREILQKLITE